MFDQSGSEPNNKNGVDVMTSSEAYNRNITCSNQRHSPSIVHNNIEHSGVPTYNLLSNGVEEHTLSSHGFLRNQLEDYSLPSHGLLHNHIEDRATHDLLPNGGMRDSLTTNNVQLDTSNGLSPVIKTDNISPHNSLSTENYSTTEKDSRDDDLGFDPWDVSMRGLAALMENEKIRSNKLQPNIPADGAFQKSLLTNCNPIHMPCANSTNQYAKPFPTFCKVLPPGFSSNGLQRYQQSNFEHREDPIYQNWSGLHPPGSYLSEHVNRMSAYNHQFGHQRQQLHTLEPSNQNRPDEFNVFAWQEGFRALLPNVNISFGADPVNQRQVPGCHADMMGTLSERNMMSNTDSRIPRSQLASLNTDHNSKNWCSASTLPDLSYDPAIVNSGGIASNKVDEEAQPHWMASLHHLTEDHTPPHYSTLPSAHPRLPPDRKSVV